MKILFICGSLEAKKDGVGDYTRRVCGQLIKLDYQVEMVSLCDHHVDSYVNEIQWVEETKVNASRIPIVLSNDKRLLIVQKILKNFQPDRISLQFVPYSFNSKGLPFWLPAFLKKLKGSYKWHIMFHELWLGIDKESSFKHKFIGQLQQIIIKKIVHSITPHSINTQNKLYQYYLKSILINAEILPICGNIPLTGLKKENKIFTQFVLFGTIHIDAPFEDFISDLIRISSIFAKPLKFIFVGKNGNEVHNYTKVLEDNFISYDVLGMQSEKEISEVLVNSDFGISTTPYYQSEKSGVYAAYKEHRIHTICVARKWTPQKGLYTIPNITKYEKNNLNIVSMNIAEFDLCSLAKQFVHSII